MTTWCLRENNNNVTWLKGPEPNPESVPEINWMSTEKKKKPGKHNPENKTVKETKRYETKSLRLNKEDETHALLMRHRVMMLG